MGVHKNSNRQLGSEKESLACKYLVRHGYRIVERNFHGGRFAELDIVARDSEGYLCFIEVKYRHDDEHGGYEGSIDNRKIRNICRCATCYLSYKKISPDTPVRFDVVFILGEDIKLVRNAFDYAWG
ncbi:MAG TPA: YraN family protein [Lachnospiraceae bacterium]|nr:YraN family protein [Lachnospiraceae bacterium]